MWQVSTHSRSQDGRRLEEDGRAGYSCQGLAHVQNPIVKGLLPSTRAVLKASRPAWPQQHCRLEKCVRLSLCLLTALTNCAQTGPFLITGGVSDTDTTSGRACWGSPAALYEPAPLPLDARNYTLALCSLTCMLS